MTPPPHPNFIWSSPASPSCEWCLWGDPASSACFIHSLEFLRCSKGLGSRMIHPQPVCSTQLRGRLIPDSPGGTPDTSCSIHPIPHPSHSSQDQHHGHCCSKSAPSCVKWQPTNFLELVGRQPDTGSICGKASFCLLLLLIFFSSGEGTKKKSPFIFEF